MGIVFIRIHSSDVSPDHFYKGPRNIDSYVIHNTDDEVDITLVSSGLTVGSSLEASKLLTSEGIKTKVINVINHKSLGADFCSSVAENKPLMTIYNGAAEVLQSNVSKVLLENNLHIPSKIVGLGFDYGTTGSTAELLQHYQLDAAGVMKKIKEVLS
jgi:transketolase C-terminal domain/subunit